MKRIIKIGQPYIDYTSDGKARLSSKVIQETDTFREELLWYETDAANGGYFTDDRIDPFVVNLLLYAMENDCDIFSVAPISEQLHYQLSEYLIPTISKNIEQYNEIKINCPFAWGG